MSKPKSPPTLDTAFDQVAQELLQIFIRKHHDYGKGNILAIKELGIAMRLSEKVERLKHLLMTEKTPNHESLDDTWNDIAVYAIIAQLFRRGWFQKLELGKKST